MSNFLRKKLHLCFSSSGGLSPSIPSSPIIVSNHNAQSHPHHTPSIFINNFNSLYDQLSVSSPLHRRHSSENPAGVFSTNRREEEEEDETTTSVSKLLSGGTAIMKHIESPDPYRDFGRSMREMVEARDLTRDVVADREYLHELLFCYLYLNPKHTHRFIVSAFADTLLWLLSPSPSPEHFLS
ncbi:Transcription repressor OFP11 [Arabidopsis thaliana]|jgi:uncharacterized protein (TIGR01568 family)|uniref:Transcription repressor OFP11 n=4 Tax=Arabidopsis TaxID=3701 RepID=OFP11_ARATH|nr:ovate family protein 11 [Arabidopsis thaliana]O23341.1 RecName: Full=Transcription repressor OFP11; AltName: Full=Ovate family protein 11; Short=AtOFP11 [Arabidopsis thaliana]KAG7616019.1 Ovate protein family C-terminal [Arabidopsis thaliana x Arabidopsis arenosa]KAG7620505.1 Ovate protein family C-terminal [Arabidopsis suecica]AEE83510.1 ovate family protein 11 [Arabidopsis thaliana]OAO99682.1 OFP11 [Arabidopsis thaliana]CAB10265.1 hypothetical protein [Arabidopsis thaliana]|eukprot:NP_193222.1 ovate family protein 11 [Arabidopsis thaliana]